MPFKFKFQTLTNKLPNEMSAKVGRATLKLEKHSPTVLFVVGVVGVVATVVLASRATLKLEEVLDGSEKNLEIARTLQSPDYSDKDRQRDIALVYTKAAIDVIKLYGPAAIVGIASVCALTGSHVILNKRNVGLTAAYAALDKGFAAYRARVVEEFGPDKDRELRHGYETREIVEETDKGPLVKTIKQPAGDGPSIYARFFDETCKNWSKEPDYNQIFLSAQQSYANNLLRSRGHVFLNEIYDSLGFARTPEGAVVGWVKGKGDDFIDFGFFRNDEYSGQRFVNGEERSILLDFNVAGIMYDQI